MPQSARRTAKRRESLRLARRRRLGAALADLKFEAVLRPTSKLAIDVPGPTLSGVGGLTVFSIMQMPLSERIRILSDAADDPIAVLFAMLNRRERASIIDCATEVLKDIATREDGT